MKNAMTKNQRIFLIGLYVCIFVFSALACREMLQDKQYITSKIINNTLVKTINGQVTTFKYFHAGKGGKQAKIKINNHKKWILLGEIDKHQANALQPGQPITVDIYPPRDGLLVKAYNVKHTVRALGIQSAQQTIRTTASAKKTLIRDNRLFIVASVVMLIIGFAGTYFTCRANPKH